jgi:hypothetical protein
MGKQIDGDDVESKMACHPRDLIRKRVCRKCTVSSPTLVLALQHSGKRC